MNEKIQYSSNIFEIFQMNISDKQQTCHTHPTMETKKCYR